VAGAALSPNPAEASSLQAVAAAFADAAERALAQGELKGLSNEELARALTAAVKLYAARSEAEGAFPPPVAADKITPTEVVLVVSEMLRAADLSLFDLAMWYRRAR
jgi:hypothetical protein